MLVLDCTVDMESPHSKQINFGSEQSCNDITKKTLVQNVS